MRSSQPSSEELIDVFRGLIEKHQVTIIHNESKMFEGIWALDVEHDEEGTFVGVGLYNDSGVHYYYSDIVLLNRCDFRTVSLVCHNGRSDLECLRQWGIDVKDTQLVFDTEIISHILDSSRHGYGLKSLANSDLGISYPSYDDIVGKRTLKQVKERKTLDQQPTELVMMYNAMDCFVTWKLYISQKKQKTDISYFEQIERPVSFILANMENRGICVDLDYLRILKNDLEQQKLPIEREIKNQLGSINLNSPKQLLEALNAKEIYPTFKGKPSTDKRAFATIKNSSIIDNLQKFSEVETLLSSFVRPYLERSESIVHPWFNQCGTRTGRLSCSNPNLLQIPRRTENGKRVRRMFKARNGFTLGNTDYGQIEPCMLAHLSQDPDMLKLFNDKKDFHTYFAAGLGIDRDTAKVFDLETYYRASKYGVARTLKCSLEEAQIQIEKAWQLFPKLRRWEEELIYNTKKSGFFTTLLGRRIKIEGLNDGNPWKREAAERQLMNNIAQASATEVMKLGMIKISMDKRFSSTFGLLVQVYDDLLYESMNIEKDQLLVEECMKEALKLSVPLSVKSGKGKTWADCH